MTSSSSAQNFPKPASFMESRPRLVDTVAFFASLSLSYFLGWTSKDLLWGLWLTSFVGGIAYTTWCLVIRKLLSAESIPQRAFLVIAGFIGVGFFSVHFGMFHYVYAIMLDLPWPLRNDPGRVYLGHLTWRGVSEFSFFETLWLVIHSYWTLAFINIGRDYANLFRLDAKYDNFQAYKKVLKLHVVMMLMVFLNFLGLESFALFVIFFLILYAPNAFWKTVFPGLARQENKSVPIPETDLKT